MSDIEGLGKGVEKLLDSISKAIGVMYEPTRIRREANALAYREKVVSDAKLETKKNEIILIANAKSEADKIIYESNSNIQARIAAKKQYLENRKQANLENVIEHGLNSVDDNVSEEPVDVDWLSKLIGYAENATSERMQSLWGKVLAGEVSSPGSFSVKSLDILRKMTQKEAEAFRDACNIASKLTPSSRENFLIYGYSSMSSLMLMPTFRNEFKINEFLTLPEIFMLSNVGLIHEDSLISGIASYKDEITIINNGTKVNAICKRAGIGLVGYKFTETGDELSRLIPDEPNEKYLKKLRESLSKGFHING